jgi:ABC-type xylose transport system permease subunit
LKLKLKIMQTIIDRLGAPTPSFFKTLRTIGVVLTAVSGVLLAAPVVLPAALVTAAGYLAVGGSVAAVVSQLTTEPAAGQSAVDPSVPAMTVAANQPSLGPSVPAMTLAVKGTDYETAIE